MKKRVVRITESQLDRISKGVIKEQGYSDFRGGDFRPLGNLEDVGKDLRTSFDFGDVDNKNQKPTFRPVTVEGSYTTSLHNCDRLHAFNDTGGKTVGGMNDKINPELIKVYKSGVNPDIDNVNIEIIKGDKEYTVNWSVDIIESKDGNAYVGFYSRGHGGNGEWVFNNVSTTSGHASIESSKKSIAIGSRGKVSDMVLVKDYEYNRMGSGCQVNQLFYKYTLIEYPPH